MSWIIKLAIAMTLIKNALYHLGDMLATTDTGLVLAWGWAAMASYVLTLIVFVIWGRIEIR